MTLSTSLYEIQRQVFRIGGPVLIAIGSISCLLNLFILTKDALRKNPCTICLIAVNIINFSYFYLGLLPTTLAVGYNIDPSTTSLAFCRFRYYVGFILACWQSSCLILASFDRTLITSGNARIRKRSTSRSVKVSMIFLGTFWLLAESHALIFTDIVEFGYNYFVCFYRPGLYTTIMTYHSLIIMGFTPTLLMAIFALWTVKNIRSIRLRRRPVQHAPITTLGMITIQRPLALRSKDRQLIQILLIDTLAYIICKFPSVIALLYIQVTSNYDKSADEQVIQQSIVQMSFFWYFIDNGIGFYKNILVAKTFRTELKRILFS